MHIHVLLVHAPVLMMYTRIDDLHTGNVQGTYKCTCKGVHIHVSVLTMYKYMYMHM